jgi:RNA polymerase sigma-54 factor
MQQGLSLSQQQKMQQVLAPQLRQSLECLQATVLELRTLVQQEIEQNPVIEEQPADNESIEVEPGGAAESDSAGDGELDFTEDYEALAKLDDEWKDYFRQHETRGSGLSEQDEEKRRFFMESLTEPVSLQEHLREQLQMDDLPPKRRQIVELLIGSIDDDGYLHLSLESLEHNTGIAAPDLEEALAVLQTYDPVGVGARTLSECLKLQLDRLGCRDRNVYELAEHHLDLLGARKIPDVARAMKCSVDDVQRMARLIGTLEPRPGRMFSHDPAHYVLPEVAIRKVGDDYQIILNNDHIPHLHISRLYRTMMEDQNAPGDVKKYIRDKIRSGSFLIRSIHQRQQTIRGIAELILEKQREFMEHGVRALKPLIMADIAERLGVHETTVSRAVSNKYMQTPQGVFEMKYFFTPGYRHEDGSQVSNKTIKELIRNAIDEEDPDHPLSDQAMADQLKEQGFQVARRTVAKYREELKILPSHMRKHEA